jgi:hypothetical protein
MPILALILFAATIAALVWKSGFGHPKAEAEISSWAEKEGVVLTKIERKDFLRGPFFLRPNTQTVYKIQKKLDDQTVTGWVLLSFMRQRVLDVIWEKPE